MENQNSAENYSSDIREISRVITRLYNQMLPSIHVVRERIPGNPLTKYEFETKIRATQISVLEALEDLSWCRNIKNENGREGVSQIDLASHLNVDTATMCRNMNILISENGWAQELQKPGSRGKILTISESGREALRQARESMKEIAKCITPEINQNYQEKMKAFKAAMEDVVNAIKKAKDKNS